MPLHKKKAHELNLAVPHNLSPYEEVFVVRFTSEVFRNYEDYLEKMALYRQKSWSCKYSGKSGLTYEQALVCEEENVQKLKEFPACYEKPVLRLVHHNTLRLDDLVSKIYNEFKDKFVRDEIVVSKYDGKDCLCRVLCKASAPPRGHASATADILAANVATTSPAVEGGEASEVKPPEMHYQVEWLLEGNNGFSSYCCLPQSRLIRKKHPLPRALLRAWILYAADLRTFGKTMVRHSCALQGTLTRSHHLARSPIHYK